MSDVKEAKPTGETETFVVDSAYLLAQAGEAVRTFVAPFSGVYRALTGRDERRSALRARRARSKRRDVEPTAS